MLDPSFAAIPVVASNVVSATADTSYTAPTHTVTLLGGQGPRQFTDGVTNSTTLLTSATGAQWNSGDVGRPVSGGSIPTGTVIASVTSGTNAVMSQPATASASGVTVTLGGGIGTLLQEVVLVGTGISVAGIVNSFLFDGTTYHLHDSFVVTAVTPSTTTAPYRLVRDYQSVWLPPGWTYCVSSWVASQLVNVSVTGLNS